MTNEQKIQALRKKMINDLNTKVPALKTKMEELFANNSKAVKIYNYTAYSGDTRKKYDLTMDNAVYDSGRNFKHIIIDQLYGHDTVKFGENTWVEDLSVYGIACVLDYVDKAIK